MNCFSSGGGKGFIWPSLGSLGRQQCLTLVGDSLWPCVCAVVHAHTWLAVAHALKLCEQLVCVCT